MALAAVPLLLERMLANLFPNWWVTSFQYNAYLVVILVCAAVDGAARLDRQLLARRHRGARVDRTVQTAGGDRPDRAVRRVVAPWSDSRLGLRPRGRDVRRRGATWSRTSRSCRPAPVVLPARMRRRGRPPRRTAVVPGGVTVEAVRQSRPAALGPGHRPALGRGRGTPPFGAPWVVANVRQRQFTFASVREQRQRVALLESNGYRVVFARGGYVVLHRAGSRGRAATASKECRRMSSGMSVGAEAETPGLAGPEAPRGRCGRAPSRGPAARAADRAAGAAGDGVAAGRAAAAARGPLHAGGSCSWCRSRWPRSWRSACAGFPAGGTGAGRAAARTGAHALVGGRGRGRGGGRVRHRTDDLPLPVHHRDA